MQDITKTFTIQWVGPFRNLQKMNEYLKDASTCDKSLFNFTISPATKKVRAFNPKSSTVISEYIKSHGIEKRLNNYHEHYQKFHENENMRIWIGSFANAKDQTESNIEDAETLFISTYGQNVFTENHKKVNANIEESICIINLFYKKNEQPWFRKPAEIRFMDDVLIHETEEKTKRTLVAKLKSVDWW